MQKCHLFKACGIENKESSMEGKRWKETERKYPSISYNEPLLESQQCVLCFAVRGVATEEH